MILLLYIYNDMIDGNNMLIIIIMSNNIMLLYGINVSLDFTETVETIVNPREAFL
jgi:hypothetical protein